MWGVNQNKMKTVKLLSVLLSLMFLSCATEDEKMTRYMIGNWETIYVNLEFPSYQGRDTLVEYDIDFANPHDPRGKEQGKPFTTFKADGTFITWAERNGRLVGQKTTAKWRATKDSLFFIFEQGPGKKDTIVPVGLKQIEDGYATRRFVDQDRDGKADDLIYLETVRLPDDEN